MGTWGTAIASDDMYLDVYGQFMDLYNKGNEVDDITDYLVESNQECITDMTSHDHVSFWFALANAQWECQKLYPDIFNKVQHLIRNDVALDFWEGTDKLKRKKVLEVFLNKISTQRPKAKQRKKTLPPMFQKGDCVTFKLKNGNYGGVVILEAILDTENQLSMNLGAATRINKTEEPVLEDFINAEVLVTNFEFDNDKQANQNIDWLFQLGKQWVKKFTKVIGKIDVAYNFNHSKNYGSMNRLDGWFEAVSERVVSQYESEFTKPKYQHIKTIKELTQNKKWTYW